jgi:hypothetical protein
MKWSLVSATNSDQAVQQGIAKSPCLKRAQDFNIMRGYPSAAAAYNAGMRKAGADVVVFAHHDVYLPEGWDSRLEKAVGTLEAEQANWAVLGVWGLAKDGVATGHVFCNASGRLLGGSFDRPVECSALDEIVLVLRRSSGVLFDEALAGFDLYGTDICLIATSQGFRSFIIPAFCLHNPVGSVFYRLSYWRWYFFMRRKWWHRLPVKTPTTVISRWPLRVPAHFINGVLKSCSGRRTLPQADDVEALYRRVTSGGQVATQ